MVKKSLSGINKKFKVEEKKEPRCSIDLYEQLIQEGEIQNSKKCKWLKPSNRLDAETYNEFWSVFNLRSSFLFELLEMVPQSLDRCNQSYESWVE